MSYISTSAPRATGVAIFLLLMFSSVHAGDVYRWLDETGKVRYSDKIPPPAAKNVTRLKSSSAGLSAERQPAADEAAQPFVSQTAAAQYPLVLFSFPECGGPCTSAEDYLNKRGVPYTLKNQEQDKAELQQVTGKLDVPALLVGKEILTGFEAGAWSKLLDAAGYARENPNVRPGNTTSTARKPETNNASAQEASTSK